MNKYLKISLFIFFTLLAYNAQSTHIMGGDLTYKHIKDSTYELKFLVYRDCNSGSAAIDQSITYWVYYKNSKKIYLNNRTVKLSPTGAQKVNPEAPSCVTPSGICIESGEYIDTVTLGGDPNGYIVTWYRHERNHAITNLRRCVATSNNSVCNSTLFCNSIREPFGMVWSAELPSYKLENSSPQFLTVPVPYFCTGKVNSFNHVAFDPDGDSLYFDLVHPYSPEQCLSAIPTPSSTSSAEDFNTIYQQVVYQTGYSVAKPFGPGTSNIVIDSETGEIRAQPNSSGNYVIAVRIREYRVDPVTHKSTYLGSIRRDLQFVAGSCPSNTPPQFTATGQSSYTVDPYDTLTFKVSGIDLTDTLFLQKKGNIFGGTGSTIKKPYAEFNDKKGYRTIDQTFTWVPTCDHITYSSPHVFTISLSDQGCNTLQRTYSITVNKRPPLAPPKIRSLEVNSNSSIKLSWNQLSNVPFFKSINIYRSINSSTPQLITSITDSTETSFTDNTVSNAHTSKYAYFIKIENECSLEGLPSDTINSVILNYTMLNDKHIKLNWNELINNPNSIKYKVQRKVNGNFITIDSTYNQSFSFWDCDLNTDWRLEIIDTSSTKNYKSYSGILTSTESDTTSPSDHGKVINANVNNWKEINLTLLKSKTSDVESYRILRSTNGGSFTSIAVIIPPAASDTFFYNDKTINSASTNKYCYKIRAIDSCQNSNSFGSSNTHCVSNLSISAGQLEAKLNWTDYIGYDRKSIIVERYDTSKSKWDTIATLAGNSTSYVDDKDIFCNVRYYYRILNIENGGNSKSYSDSAYVTAIDTVKPDDVNLLSASNVDDTSTVVRFLQASAKDVNQYIVIWLEYNKGVFTTTGIATYPKNDKDTMTFTFKTPNSSTRQYCIRLYAVDSCSQNFSNNTEFHCASFLSGNAQNLQNRLTWTAYSGFKVANYIVERKDEGKWKTIANLSNTTFSYTDNNLPCNIKQEYRIKVVENTTNAEVSYSNALNLTPFDTIKPITPKINYISATDNKTIQLNFSPTSSGDVKIYQIEYSINNSNFSIIDTVKHDGLSTYNFIHDTLNTLKNQYAYRVIAVDSCADNKSVNNKIHKSIQLNGQPGNLENELDWTAYEGFDIKEYQVQTLNKNTNTWSTLSTLNNSTLKYLHKNVNCTDTVTYRVIAIDKNNSSIVSSSAKISLSPYDTLRPESPNIKSISINGNTITLNWDKSSSPDVVDYVIYKRASGTSTFTAIDTVYNQFSFSEKTNINIIWEYSLKSIDSCARNISYNFSNPHNNIVLSTQSIGCDGEIVLSWNSYNNFKNGINKYEIYRSVDGNAEKLIASTSNLTYSDKAVSQHHYYSYRIKAIENNPSGEYSYSNKVTDTQPYITVAPKVKHSSKLITDPINGEVLIEWESQENKKLIASSRLYYKPLASSSFSILQNNISLKDSSFIQKNIATTNNDYQYFLVNIDSCNNVSDTVSIHKTMDMNFSIGQLIHKLDWTAYEGFIINEYVLQQLIGSTWVNLDTINASNNQFTKLPAPCNTVITYRIGAYSSDGYLAYSDTTSGLAIDTLYPDAPELNNLSTINNEYSKIDFTGVDSLDVYGFAIMRSRGGRAFLNQGIVLFNGVKQKSTYNDTTRVDSNSFCYYVVALDSCLNATVSDTFCSIYLQGKESNYANELWWKPFKGYQIANYEIEVENSGKWQKIGTVTGQYTIFTHQDVGCNTGVKYRIKGIEQNGIRITYSNEMILTPFDTIAPSKPQMIASSVIDSNLVEITWEWDQTSDEKYFDIYRGTDSNSLKLINRVSLNNKYIDTVTNTQSSTYFYSIKAIDSCSMSNISPYADTINSFYTLISKDTCIATTYLDWTVVRGLQGYDKFNIYRKIPSNSNFSRIASIGSNSFHFEDTLVKVNQVYCYKIQAENTSNGYNAYTDSVCIKQSVRPTPSAPQFNFASVLESDLTNGKVTINWNKKTKDQEPYLIGYRIYRADTVGGKYVQIGQTSSRNDTTFEHTSNTSTEYHYYRVTGINTCSIDGDTSNLHSPIQLSVKNLNLSSELNWTEYFGFDVQKYEIYSSVTGGMFNKIGEVPSTQFEFTDTTVGCGDSIAFYVKAISNLKYESTSDIESVIGFDTTLPEPINISTITTINNGSEFKLDWEPSKSDDAEYYIVSYRKFNSLKWDTLTTTATGTSINISSLPIPTAGIAYEFKITSIDSCGNAQPEFSPEHRSIALDAIDLSSANLLKWNNYKGAAIEEYELYRDDTLIQTVSGLNTISDTTYQVIDSNLTCEPTLYNYYVLAKVAENNKIISSNYDTITNHNFAAPNGIYLKTASVISIKNDLVQLKWTKSYQNDAVNYKVLRANSYGEAFDTIATTTKTSFKDEIDINGRKLCYAIAVNDACNNASEPSNLGCIIVLEGGNLDLANSIKWNDYYQWHDSISSYTLYKSEDSVNWTPIKIQDSRTRSWVDTNLNDETATYCYRILAEEVDGNYEEKAWSTTLYATQEPIVFIPNAFSPGISENINDVFGPFGSFIPKDFSMTVYNRWGQIIHHTTQGEYWDGKTADRTLVPIDIYQYIITFKSKNGVEYKYSGKVQVIR